MASLTAPKPRRRAKAPGLSWKLVRSGGRSREMLAFEEEVVGFFLESASLLGIPKSLAAIYGICFASPAPLRFTEVHERLGLSSGSISQGLRVLCEMGALKVVTADTDRRECFTPDLELRKVVEHWLSQRLERQLTAGKGLLQAMLQAVPAVDDGTPDTLHERMDQLQNWHRKASAVLPLVRAFLKLSPV